MIEAEKRCAETISEHLLISALSHVAIALHTHLDKQKISP